MTLQIALAPDAEDNAMATLMADLLRQNLDSKPHKQADFEALDGILAIVAEDAEVSVTLRFSRGEVTLHDGIVGIPDITIRGESEGILSLSNLPLHRWLRLPIASPLEPEGWKVLRELGSQVLSRKLLLQGALMHLPFLVRLARVLSVNG